MKAEEEYVKIGEKLDDQARKIDNIHTKVSEDRLRNLHKKFEQISDTAAKACDNQVKIKKRLPQTESYFRVLTSCKT